MLYTRVAKVLDIYLLEGNGKNFEESGCEVRFHPIQELLSKLREKKNSVTKTRIEWLVTQINKILQKLNPNAQILITQY